MAEWSKAAVLKTVIPSDRGREFESHSLLQASLFELRPASQKISTLPFKLMKKIFIFTLVFVHVLHASDSDSEPDNLEIYPQFKLEACRRRIAYYNAQLRENIRDPQSVNRLRTKLRTLHRRANRLTEVIRTSSACPAPDTSHVEFVVFITEPPSAATPAVTINVR